jgi:hypothetical protein
LLAALGRTTERFGHILHEASENCSGQSDADLKRLKYVCTNLKGGFVEASTHARFLQGARRSAREREAHSCGADAQLLSPPFKWTALNANLLDAPAAPPDTERVRAAVRLSGGWLTACV